MQAFFGELYHHLLFHYFYTDFYTFAKGWWLFLGISLFVHLNIVGMYLKNVFNQNDNAYTKCDTNTRMNQIFHEDEF